MRERLGSLINSELRHWHALADTTKKLLWSMTIYDLAGPMLNTFTFAYIYRSTNAVEYSAWLNLGWYITTPIMFYLNGLLLKRYSIKLLHGIGLVLMGLVNLLIFLIPITSQSLFMIGLLLGIPIALYWANRNFLALEVTTDSQRNFTKSFEAITSISIGVILPPIIGASLVKMEMMGWWSFTTGYRFWMILSIFFLFCAGWVLRNADIKNPKPRFGLLKNVSPTWKKIRLARFIQGIPNGVETFLPAIIILHILGNESVLGNTQAIMSLLSIIILYWFGTRVRQLHRMKLVTTGYYFLLLMACVFAILFNQLGVILYLLGIYMANQFTWTALEGIMMKIIDDEESGDRTNNYAYIVDQEIFLQVGRVLGTTFLISLVFLSTPNFALRIVPIIMALAMVILGKVVKNETSKTRI